MTDSARDHRPDQPRPDARRGDAAAIQGVDVGRSGDHVDVTLPGTSGHRAPGERAELVDAVLDDEQVRTAEHVTLAVPRGDTEALLQAKHRLGDAQTRPAGASIIVESDLPDPPGRDEPAADEPGT